MIPKNMTVTAEIYDGEGMQSKELQVFKKGVHMANVTDEGGFYRIYIHSGGGMSKQECETIASFADPLIFKLLWDHLKANPQTK